ncbi:lamin tail domain-containing protein [Candidatus Saccharibacteria bacterium]|nr:lamin tail domain-containing protein [Candidatus Saccharibacteria bacterium]
MKRLILFIQITISILIPATASATSLIGDAFPDTSFASPSTLTEPPGIAIRAINPGYTTDAGKNSGELIELINLSGATVDLSGIEIIYSSSSGKSTTLYQFPSGSKFIGESILLRYKSAPEATDGNQDLLYDTSIAMSGSLALVFNDKTISSVCWSGGTSCLPVFSTTVKSRSYTTIIRDPDTGKYLHVAGYTLTYNSSASGLYLPSVISEDQDSTPPDPDTSSPTLSLDVQCLGLTFTEILSYYDADASEQFIELYNSGDSPVELHTCTLRYKSKTYPLVSTPTTLAPSEYFVLRPSFRLTKNPTTANTLELFDTNSELIAKLILPHGQKKSASYALIDYNLDGTENWKVTYMPTPGAINVYQEYQTCPVGKIINTATGNCVKAATISSTIKDCPAGKYRNPLTGRCKSIASSASESTPCKEGYERNHDTNRCRKIRTGLNAEYPTVPVTGVEEKSTFIAFWAIGGVIILGGGYIIFQFRREIRYAFRQFLTKLKH